MDEQKKKKALEQYRRFCTVYFVEQNIEEALTTLADDFFCLGLGSCGPIRGKLAFARLAICWPSPLASINFEAVSCDAVGDSVVSIQATVLLSEPQGCPVPGTRRLYHSVLCKEEEGSYRLLSFHASKGTDSHDYSGIGLQESNRSPLPQAEAVDSAVKETKRYYEKILDSLPNLLVITDEERRIVHLNKSASKLVQQPLHACVGKHCWDILKSPNCFSENCSLGCLERGVTQTYCGKDNHCFQMNASFLTDQNGNWIGQLEVGTDITEQREAEEKIKFLSSNIPGGICEMELDEFLTLQTGNAAFFDLIGYSKPQFLIECQNKVSRVLGRTSCSSYKKAVAEALVGGQVEVSCEGQICRRDGRMIWVMINGTLVKNNRAIRTVLVDITDRKKLEEDLKDSQAQLRTAMVSNSSYVYDYNILTKQMIQPSGIASLYDMPSVMENVPDSIINNGVICEESQKDFLSMYEDIKNGKPTASCVIKTLSDTGDVLWNKMTMTSIFDEENRPVRAMGLIEDITKQKKMEMDYFQEEQYRNAMLSDVVLYLEMNITRDTFSKRKGNWDFSFAWEVDSRYSAILEATIRNDIVEEFQQSYFDAFSRENVIRAYADGRRKWKLEYLRKLCDGQVAWMLTTITLVEDCLSGEIKGFMYVRDIDQRKREELRLEYDLQHDPLTGVFNKATTESQIKKILAMEAEYLHAFLIFDIDHFKRINDTYGHFIGDQVLSETARTLSAIFRSEDVIGRIGGDEFVVLLRKIPDKNFVNSFALKICQRLRHPAPETGDFPYISCSIGISISGSGGDDFVELYKNADDALYEAKRLGRNRFVLYQPNEFASNHRPATSPLQDDDPLENGTDSGNRKDDTK